MANAPANSAALRRLLTRIKRCLLTCTKTGPSKLCDLLVRRHSDPAAVRELCDVAEGSFPLLTAVFAAQIQVMDGTSDATTEAQIDAAYLFDRQVESWLRGQFQDATETELLKSLRTARTKFPEDDQRLPWKISFLSLRFAPLKSFTDKVVSQMPLRQGLDPCPQLGAGSMPKVFYGPDDKGRWLVSRYLYKHFGTEDGPWTVFRGLYDPHVMTIGEAVALVEKLEGT